jgi:hypothetical protein
MLNLFGKQRKSEKTPPRRDREGRDDQRPRDQAEEFDDRHDEEHPDNGTEEDTPGHRGERHNGRQSAARQQPRLPGNKAIALAREYLQELTGQVPESISGLNSQDGRWKVTLDVVELERIPRTTDVMASYEVELDDRGELIGYRRVGRYYRSQVDQG